MGNVKKNPNDVQINQAKTTRPGNFEKSKSRETGKIIFCLLAISGGMPTCML
jgi:hypothetical protein